MNLNLLNKRALVCGSTDGIGWATAQYLATEGASVTLFARNREKLKKRIQELPANFSQKHTYLLADFNSLQEVKSAIDSQDHSFDILINNTGGPTGGKLIEEPLEKFTETFEQHLVVNQLLAQSLTPYMKDKNFGRIINIISISVKQPIEGLGVSNTVRWAVASWAKTLSKELSHTGITVNNVLPGFTKTSRLKQVNLMKAQSQNISVEEVEKQLIEKVPSGRFTQAEEVAAAVVFLCSSQAQCINGINLPVDGGFSANL